MVTAKGLLSFSMFIFYGRISTGDLFRLDEDQGQLRVLATLSVPKKTPAGSTFSTSPGYLTCADVWMNLPAIALSITHTQPGFTPQT